MEMLESQMREVLKGRVQDLALESWREKEVLVLVEQAATLGIQIGKRSAEEVAVGFVEQDLY